MPQRNVATNFTFEQQRIEINNLAQDFWAQKGTVDTAAPTYLLKDGTNAFTGASLAVPAAFTINSNAGAGTVTINGNLQVDGTTTTLNSTTLEISDKNLVIAKGGANDAAVDGAGITIDSATDITWNFVDAKDAWVSSIGIEATGALKVGGNATFGANGSITSGANFILSGNKFRVTGTDTVGLEVQRAGNATIQCTDTTNSTDLQLRANATGGLIRTATAFPLILGTSQEERLRIHESNAFVTVNHGNAENNAALILSKHADGYAKLEFDVGTSQKAYVELDGNENLVHYGAAGVQQEFYAGGSSRFTIGTGGSLQSKGGGAIFEQDEDNGYNAAWAKASGKIAVKGDLSGGNYFGWREKNVAAGSVTQANAEKKLPTINDFTYPNSSSGILLASTSKIGFAASSESPQYGSGVTMLFDSDGLALGSSRAFDCSDTVSANTTAKIKLLGSSGKLSLGTVNTNEILTINSGASTNAVSIRNTTGGNGSVGILFSTQDHSGGREKAAIFHQETHGQAHYGGDFIFCLNSATGGATQVSTADERFRIKRDGNCNITNGNLEIRNNGNTPLLLLKGASNNEVGKIDADQASPTTSHMRFYTENAGDLGERLRIDNKGRVLISRSEAITQLNGNDAALHVSGPTDGGTGGIYVHMNGQSAGTASPQYGIKIDALNCANNASHQYGMMIDVDQQLVGPETGILNDVFGSYNTTKVYDGILRKQVGAFTNGYTYFSNIIETASGGSTYHFVGQNDGSDRIRISLGGNVTNTNNSYGSISDIKLKENIVDANSQWADIKAVKVRNFNFKTDSSTKLLGVVAQELETVSAGLVHTDNDITVDEVTGEGTVTGTTKSVKYSVLYMKAIKALQEAMTRIETLETKVTALEG